MLASGHQIELDTVDLFVFISGKETVHIILYAGTQIDPCNYV